MIDGPPRTGSPRHSPRPPTQSSGWRNTFVALSNRNFRWFWLGSLAQFTSMQMAQVAQGWLVYSITSSALALGAVSAAFGIPMLLLSPIAGVVTDRVDKRALLLWTNSIVGAVIAMMAALIITGRIEYWHILVAAAISGSVGTFAMPSRQSMVPELVEGPQIMNAVALNSTGMNATRIVAPALAGALVPLIDVGGIYVIMATCYAWVLFTLLMIPPLPPAHATTAAPLRELAAGLRYARHNSTVLMLLGMAFGFTIFGMPFMVLLPVFASDVFGVGAPGLGMLMTASGVGAIVGSLAIAASGDPQRKGVLLTGAGIVAGVSFALFANAASFPLALVFQGAGGLAGSIYMAVNNTLLMTRVSREMLGRVMSIYMMTFGLMPFATLPAGALAEAVGAPLAMTLGGAMLALLALALLVLSPGARRLS